MIDSKYRVGSEYFGTLKKFEEFKDYRKMLNQRNYIPIFLILRDDSLKSTLFKMKAGGWNIIQGENNCRESLYKHTSIDFKSFL